LKRTSIFEGPNSILEDFICKHFSNKPDEKTPRKKARERSNILKKKKFGSTFMHDSIATNKYQIQPHAIK